MLWKGQAKTYHNGEELEHEYKTKLEVILRHGYEWTATRLQITLNRSIITVRNEVAKVMFLHLSVSHSVHRGGSTWAGTPGPGTPPRTRYPPLGPGTLPDQVHPRDQVPPRQVHPPGPDTPPGQVLPQQVPPNPNTRLLLRTVRILLECILVTGYFCDNSGRQLFIQIYYISRIFYSLFKESSFWHQNDRIGGQSIICVNFTSSKTRKSSRKLDERRSKYVLSSCFTRA